MCKPKKVSVCCGRNCNDSADRLIDELKDTGAEVECSGCVGDCEKGPNVVVDDKIYHHSKPDTIVEKINKGEGKVITPSTFDDLKLDEELI